MPLYLSQDLESRKGELNLKYHQMIYSQMYAGCLGKDMADGDDVIFPFPGFTRVIVSESVAIDHAKFYICLYETVSESAKHLFHSYVYMSDACVTTYDVCR